MAKLRVFQVTNGRLHFKCPFCRSTRMLTVPAVARQRTVKCHKCDEVTRCSLNRRASPRQVQSGKVMMITNDGKTQDVDLFDISQNGIGFEVPVREKMTIGLGSEISFRCTWNPFLLNRGRYRVRAIKGRRVGAMKVG